MLCGPVRSCDIEGDGKMVACVYYGGTLKGAVIVTFGYYPCVRLKPMKNVTELQSGWAATN
jgi:hypothetical protein